MKLFTVVALASMAALASADDPWEVSFWCSSDGSGKAIVDEKGSASKNCTDIPGCPPPNGTGGALSMEFKRKPPPYCSVTFFTGPGCTGTSTTVATSTNGKISIPPPGAKSYNITCNPTPP